MQIYLPPQWLRSFVLLGSFLSSATSLAVCVKPYPVPPSSQAIVLFGVNADSTTGAIQDPGGGVHFEGSGTMRWKVRVPQAGAYRVRVSYAADMPGVDIAVLAGPSTIKSSLPVTKGFFINTERTVPRGFLFPKGLPDWLQRNYERRDVGSTVQLAQGENLLTLSIHSPSKEAGFSLSSVELLAACDNPDDDARRARKQRADPAWLMNAGYGLMFHWTSQTMPRSGPPKSYRDAVNAFDVSAFVEMVQKTGAKYVVFTANHQDPHFPGPLKDWEAVHPGWTTKRDLIGEIADALNAHGIKLILYFNTPGMGNFSTPGMNKTPDPPEQEFVANVLKLVTEVGNRYGNRISGYWLDSFNFIDSKYPNFPYERLFQACKVGNPDRLIALNSWVLPVDTMWQDYWAGELVTTGNPPSTLPQSMGPATGLPFQALLALYGTWVHAWPDTAIKPPIFTVDELSRFIKGTLGKGAVTINTGIYQDGTIGQEQTRYFEQLRKSVYGR